MKNLLFTFLIIVLVSCKENSSKAIINSDEKNDDLSGFTDMGSAVMDEPLSSNDINTIVYENVAAPNYDNEIIIGLWSCGADSNHVNIELRKDNVCTYKVFKNTSNTYTDYGKYELKTTDNILIIKLSNEQEIRYEYNIIGNSLMFLRELGTETTLSFGKVK